MAEKDWKQGQGEAGQFTNPSPQKPNQDKDSYNDYVNGFNEQKKRQGG